MAAISKRFVYNLIITALMSMLKKFLGPSLVTIVFKGIKSLPCNVPSILNFKTTFREKWNAKEKNEKQKTAN